MPPEKNLGKVPLSIRFTPSTVEALDNLTKLTGGASRHAIAVKALELGLRTIAEESTPTDPHAVAEALLGLLAAHGIRLVWD